MIQIIEAAVMMTVNGEPSELDQIGDDIRYQPTGYHFAPSYERWRLSGGQQGWDGYVRPLKRLSKGQAVVLRGWRDTILAICQTHGFQVDPSRLYPRPFKNLILTDIPDDLIESSFRLDDHQRVAIHSWLVQGIGINQIVVAGGKTACFAGAARMIKTRFPEACFLYLTPSERLVKQVTVEMRKFLPDFEVGQYGGGQDQHDAKDMVVCTVAMLNRHVRDLQVTRWFRRFMAIFYDEVHHAASESSERVVTQVAAYFRLGATDSAKDNDPDRHAKMVGLFGSILNRMSGKPLLDAGRLAMPHIYVQDMGKWKNRFKDVPLRAVPGTTAWCLFEQEWRKGTYLGPVLKLDKDGQQVIRRRKKLELVDDKLVDVIEESPVSEIGLHRVELPNVGECEVESRWVLLNRMYDEAIVRFKARNNLIADWAEHFSGQGLPTLVVATRTVHIYLLETQLQARVDPNLVRICFGWATTKQRDAAFEWFRNTPGSILISPLVKEGVSINEIRAGVIADYVGDVETAHQIIGRFMRKKDVDNFAEIVWFRDSQHPVLRRGSSRIIHAMGINYGYPVYDPPPERGG